MPDDSESEENGLLRALHAIRTKYTDANGITHRPYGVDWCALEKTMYRLLILRAAIKPGDRVHIDPWDLYVSQYASGKVTMYRPDRGSIPYFPSSIMVQQQQNQQANGNGNGSSSNNKCTSVNGNGFPPELNRTQSAGPSPAPSPSPSTHVRFDEHLVTRPVETHRRPPMGRLARSFS